MVKTLDPDLAWDEYKILEEDFIEYLRYVPFTTEHENVWSLYLGDLLIRIGSILDSFFRRAIDSDVLDSANSINTYRNLDDRDINFGTYRKLYDSFYKLSSKKIYEHRSFEKFVPFSKWSSGKAPDWWDNYNHVKHDRFENKKEATLKSVLEALSGLFIINVIHLETMPVLVDYDVIRSGGYNKEYLKKILMDKEPLEGLNTIYAKSKLFGYVFELEKHVPDAERVLSRSYLGY